MTSERRLGVAAAATVVATLLLASAGGAGALVGEEGGTFRVVEAGLFNAIDPASRARVQVF